MKRTVRIAESGKVYQYDYKILYLQNEIHSELKKQAKFQKLTMNEYIGSLMDKKVCTCPSNGSQNN